MEGSNTESSNESLLQRSRTHNTEVLKRYGNNNTFSKDFDKQVIAYAKRSVNNGFVKKQFSGK